MRNRFDEQLHTLNHELLEMGALIERAIRSATDALVKQDVEAALQAIAADKEVNQAERDIESLCMKLLLQQQPVARDLRLISSALKMITDMERIGDQAADIAELVVFLSKEPYRKELKYLPQMAEKAICMVGSALDAYVRKDLVLAQEVMGMDDEIDKLFVTVKEDLIAAIHSDVNVGSQAIDLLMIAKYYERIGDHAQNIAEWVEYALTGKHKGVFLT